jgi:hypothetical protein
MLTRRRQHAIALVFVGLFVVTVAWRGFDVAWNGAIVIIARAPATCNGVALKRGSGRRRSVD